MCFSASASFIASGALAVLGGVSLASANKKDKVLAAIPIMFSIQQFCEGIQWLYLNSGYSSPIIGYFFLFFSFIIWPVYVPSVVYLLDKAERKILGWFILAGSAVAIYFTTVLITGPLDIYKINSCVNYSFDFPFRNFVILAYLLAVVGSFCISSINILRYFGITIGFLGLVSWFFFEYTFTSVWCFFAAIVSLMFYFYIRYKRKVNKLMEKVNNGVMRK
ncbi:MAG: DUF6629 family protein [bacterium]